MQQAASGFCQTILQNTQVQNPRVCAQQVAGETGAVPGEAVNFLTQDNHVVNAHFNIFVCARSKQLASLALYLAKRRPVAFPTRNVRPQTLPSPRITSLQCRACHVALTAAL